MQIYVAMRRNVKEICLLASSSRFQFLCPSINSLILRSKTVNSHFYIPRTNLFLTKLVIFKLIDVQFCNEFRPVFGHGYVTDDAITLNFLRVMFYGKCHFHVVWHPPWLQIEKVIWHLRFSGAKDSGKVLNYILHLKLL